jgi:hypothetical protein
MTAVTRAVRIIFALAIAALNAGWFGWFWYGLPLSRRT